MAPLRYPVPPALGLSQSFSLHLTEVLKEITGAGPPMTAERMQERHYGLSICGELETLALVIDEAFRNQISLEFAVEELCVALEGSTGKMTKDEYLRANFQVPHPPNGKPRLVSKPCTYVDRAGNVVIWYLPGAFTKRRSVSEPDMASAAPGWSTYAVKRTKDEVFTAVKTCTDDGKSLLEMKVRTDNWRNDVQGFANPRKCDIRPGVLNMSACWHTQAASAHSKPGPSASLKDPKMGGHTLLSRLLETNAMIGALLSVVHPTLYNEQVRVLAEIFGDPMLTSEPELTQTLSRLWSTPFTGFALLANRESIFHRDTKGGKKLYDVLAAFGKYDTGRLEVPLLHARFVYNPGTVFVLPGYLFEHGASVTDGERICIASFMKPNVGRGVLKDYREVPLPTRGHLADVFGWSRADIKISGRDIWA